MNTRRAPARSFYLKAKRSIQKLPHFFANRSVLGVKLIKKKPQDAYDNALSSEGLSLNENAISFDYDNALSSEEVVINNSKPGSGQVRDSLESQVSCASSSIFSSIHTSVSSKSKDIVPQSKKEKAERKLEIELNLWIANNYGKESGYLPLSIIKDLVDKSPKSKLAHKFDEMRQVDVLVSEDSISHFENKKPVL